MENNALSYFLLAQGFIVLIILIAIAGLWLNYRNSRKLYLAIRSEEHTSELQSRRNLVCRLLLEKKKKKKREKKKKKKKKKKRVRHATTNAVGKSTVAENRGKERCEDYTGICRYEQNCHKIREPMTVLLR